MNTGRQAKITRGKGGYRSALILMAMLMLLSIALAGCGAKSDDTNTPPTAEGVSAPQNSPAIPHLSRG